MCSNDAFAARQCCKVCGSSPIKLAARGLKSPFYRTPTLLISSAKDRLLGSLQEGARLERVMANAMRVVLPRSGHTALLEVWFVNPQVAQHLH